MTDASCDQSVNISQLLQTEITFTYALDLVNDTRTSFTHSKWKSDIHFQLRTNSQKSSSDADMLYTF